MKKPFLNRYKHICTQIHTIYTHTQIPEREWRNEDRITRTDLAHKSLSEARQSTALQISCHTSNNTLSFPLGEKVSTGEFLKNEEKAISMEMQGEEPLFIVKWDEVTFCVTLCTVCSLSFIFFQFCITLHPNETLSLFVCLPWSAPTPYHGLHFGPSFDGNRQ